MGALEAHHYTSAPLAVAGLALLALCSYYLLVVAGHHRRVSKPGKRYPPVVGTVFHQLYHVRRLHDYLTDLFRERKTFQLLAPAGRRQIYTSDPAVMEHILRTNFTNYGKGAYNYENMTDLLGDGIFAVDGDKWRQQRKMASYDFSTRALRDFSGAVFKQNAVRLAGVVSGAAAAGRPVEFQGLALKATMDSCCDASVAYPFPNNSIFTIAFGLDLDTLGGSGEGTRFAAAFDDASEFTLLRYVNAFWKAMRLLNVGSEAALRDRVRVVDEFVYKLIRDRSQELSCSNAGQDSRQDMLSRFIQAATDESGTVDYKYLRDIILNIVIAGKDTTAGALAWFLYMACKHPEVQEKSLTDEALNKMHYLHAALTETLRLYPSVPLDNKQCLGDDVLPDGSSVSKGDIVFYVPYARGRMEYLWGADAEAFRPERWLGGGGGGEFQEQSPFKFTAFQAGPRICLGKEFAYRQMKLFAAVLLRSFAFRLRDGEGATRGLHRTATA
ncbi:hypothetical protein PVAP13_9NG496200, partial [Panicum virgatum]